MKFEGRTFFITGGVSGLGEGVARLFVSKGANVVLADINSSKGKKMVAELGEKQAIFARCDVTKEKSVQEAIEAGLAKFGALHGCVNCAGIGYPRRTLSKSGKEHPLGPFSKVIEINLIGSFNVLRLCAKAMIQNKPDVDSLERGVIINTASVAAFDGQIGQAAYSASKAGVCGMTLPIARDLGGFGIRICTIAPGIFETPMTKMMPKSTAQKLIDQKQFPKRMGYPSEFAKLASHIVENAFLNGEVIRLDAAIRMQPQ
eukprot:CAMPEP_0197021708 /NCGR_PEP_ID=MMETSP1384-20130603/2654_1 /TAXON_ID=29189 /ORGANISM="Ammonia sp." /LENGTH=258 /DNA_ID=CAMNT_0042449601 /DNA_START=63 /DNA_END=839 /DNA_ORIENTATION=+